MKHLYTAHSKINGDGLFTSRSFNERDVVGYIHGPTQVIRNFTHSLSQQTVNWIGAGRYTWINTDESPFRFINHSCDPNVAIVTKRKVIALKPIAADNELTMDYSLTEMEPGWTIEYCQCNTARCRQTIRTTVELPRNVFERCRAHMTKNFIRIYEATHKRQ